MSFNKCHSTSASQQVPVNKCQSITSSQQVPVNKCQSTNCTSTNCTQHVQIKPLHINKLHFKNLHPTSFHLKNFHLKNFQITKIQIQSWQIENLHSRCTRLVCTGTLHIYTTEPVWTSVWQGYLCVGDSQRSQKCKGQDGGADRVMEGWSEESK